MCIVVVFEENILGIPTVTTKSGWEKFVGPAVFIGKLFSADDLEIGTVIRETFSARVEEFPDKSIDRDLLVSSISLYGLNSINSLFRKCLQMVVEQEAEDRYKLVPFEPKKEVR